MSLAIHGLSGWGFSPRSLKELHSDIQPINYMNCNALDNINTLAQYVADQLPDQSNLFGWSFGGLIATAIAINHPTKVARLILLASQPKLVADSDWSGISPDDASQFESGMRINPDKQLSRFVSLVAMPHQNKPLRAQLKHYSTHHNAPALSSLLNTLFYSDLRQGYKKLMMPILHIINDSDAILQQNASHLLAINPSAQITVLNDASHASLFTHNQQIDSIMKDFIPNAME